MRVPRDRYGTTTNSHTPMGWEFGSSVTPRTEPHFPPLTSPNEPRPGLIAPAAADSDPDSQPSGARDSANGCAGVANSAPQPRRGGKPGRSGPPGNTHARKHGGSRVGIELKELVYRAVADGRTVEARDMTEWAGAVAADLGGVDNLSRQQQTLLDLAARTKLQLDRIDAWLFRQPALVNKRTRALHPVVSQRQSLVSTLRQLLGDLGLERRAKDAVTLDAYLSRRAQLAGSNAATGAFTPGTQPGAAGSAPAEDGGEDGNITGTTRAP